MRTYDYEFKPGAVITTSKRGVKVTADAVGESLELIENDKGEVTPAALVEVARAPDHPLHWCFDWNNKSAADKFRLQQARHLIASVRIIEFEGKASVPAYVSIRAEEGQRAYVPIKRIVNSRALSIALLEQCRKDIATLRTKYREFSDLLDPLHHIEKELERRAKKARDATAAPMDGTPSP